MADSTPARIDRAALERIIQRAAELQAAERSMGDGLTTEEVLALGKEVGIPAGYLQQALLEERARVAVEQSGGGAIERIAGPAQVSAQRVVRGEVDAIEQTLLRWMDQHELLCVQRHRPGRIVWEPLGGIQAAIRRSTAAFGAGRKPYMLGRAETVTATIVGLEPGYAMVVLIATAPKTRAAYLAGSATMATLGVGAAAALAALDAMLALALLPIPAGLGGAWGVLRQYPPILLRLQTGLERALDHLEAVGGRAMTPRQLTERPPSIIGLLAEEVRRALKP